MVSRARAVGGVGPAAAANVALTAFVAAAWGSGGALSVLGGLVLAPLSVLATAAVARRIAGRRLALAAGWTVIALPLVAQAFFTPTYRHTWTHTVLPHLVGVRAPGWLALGVAVALVTAVGPARELAGAGVVAAAAGVVAYGLGDLNVVRVGIHETGWSVAFSEWLPAAGILGAVRRAPFLGIAVAGWFVFVVLRAASAGYDGGAFWSALAPGVPAAAILVTSIGLLVPPLRRRVPQAAH